MSGRFQLAVWMGLCMSLAAAPVAGQEQEPGPGALPRAVRAEEVVVSATRIETPAREVASSVTVITAEELERRHVTTVPEALRTVPGLAVVQTGGQTGVAAVFMRGADAEQTLVMINGIVMNDPSSPSRGFDFSTLDVAMIERIEVIRGPQSTLYGSDAMGGVIHIVTKRGKGPPRVTVYAEAGTYDTLNSSAGVTGSAGALDYSASFSRRASEGFSAADEDDGNREADGYLNTTLDLRLGYAFSGAFRLDLFVTNIDHENDVDALGAAGVEDDPNFTYATDQRFQRLQGTLDLWDKRWNQQLGYSVATTEREAINKQDDAHPDDSSEGTFEGTVSKLDWQHNLLLHDSHTLTLGLESQQETATSSYLSESAFGPFASEFPEQTARTDSVYAQDQMRFAEAFFATVGARSDDHDRFGRVETYRVTAAYLFASDTKVKATYGTGFKAPSLYQLFDPAYGNPELEPEESVGWDAGVEQGLGGWTTLGLTYFENRFENLIDADPLTFRYVNIAKAKTNGFEALASFDPDARWNADLTYTRTYSEDEITGKPLLRRPSYQASLDGGYQISDRSRTHLTVLRTGPRDDLDFSEFPARQVKLDPYTVVGFSGEYDVLTWLTAHARVENAFDEDYEEIIGYGVPGQAVYAGLRATF